MKFDKVVHSGLVFEIFPAFSEIQVYNDDGRWNGYKQYQYHNIPRELGRAWVHLPSLFSVRMHLKKTQDTTLCL